MHRSARLVLLILVTATFAGCASSKHWSVSGAEKDEGLVRVSYEFPEAREPALSDKAAQELAEHRCEGWGYDDAEPIAGQLRQCSNMDAGSCNLWTVTREYQCTREVAQGSHGIARANMVAR